MQFLQELESSVIKFLLVRMQLQSSPIQLLPVRIELESLKLCSDLNSVLLHFMY